MEELNESCDFFKISDDWFNILLKSERYSVTTLSDSTVVFLVATKYKTEDTLLIVSAEMELSAVWFKVSKMLLVLYINCFKESSVSSL